MKLGLALREVHRSETELAEALLHLSERHVVVHDVHLLARDLAGWSADHVRQVAAAAGDHGEELDPDPVRDPGVARRVRERLSEALGRARAPELALLSDLRTVYVLAHGVASDWELIGQAAQGVRARDLVDLSQRCRSETIRQARWADAMLKESATQILVS